MVLKSNRFDNDRVRYLELNANWKTFNIYSVEGGPFNSMITWRFLKEVVGGRGIGKLNKKT